MSGKSTSSKHSNKINTTKTTMMGIAFVVVILFIVMAALSLTLHEKVEADQQKVSVLQEQINDETKRTDEIENLEDYMKSDEYIEQVAKEKLGMVNDGEIIFKESD